MDVSRLDQWEIVFEHGTKLGMYLHFKTMETENELLLDEGDLGPQRKLYYRELIARFSHHLALNWNLGEEINNATHEQKVAWANYLWTQDPYRHHIVIHNMGEPHYDLLGKASRLTGFSLQTNRPDFSQVHRRTRDYLYLSVTAGKPWVVSCDEPGAAPVAPESVHRAAEAIRLAFYDKIAYAGDPDATDMPIERLLSKEYAKEQRARIDDGRPAIATHGGDTTSFATADGEGNLVKFIQSTFQPWGAAVLVPGTGVMLNDRMYGFSVDANSPNVVRPGMRANHTLNTWLLEREGGPTYAGGTPGADYQVQVNLQVVSGLVDFNLNPQAAINAPKWVLTGPGDLALEARFPDATFQELERRGHTLVRGADWETTLCRAQMVGRHADGTLIGASDARAEGTALSF